METITVKELISKLENLSQDKIIVTDDADTNWLLNITRITELEDIVVIGSSYGDKYYDQ